MYTILFFFLKSRVYYVLLSINFLNIITSSDLASVSREITPEMYNSIFILITVVVFEENLSDVELSRSGWFSALEFTSS